MTSPYLPGYAFVRASHEQWHDLKLCRRVKSLMIVPQSSEKSVRRFIDRVEADYSERAAQIEAAQAVIRNKDATKEQRKAALVAVAQYAPGDLLEIITGPFAGLLARFRRVSDGVHPEVVADVEAFGATVPARVDLGGVRRAAKELAIRTEGTPK